MSAEEGFLARWSRRKRGAPAVLRERPSPQSAESEEASKAPAIPPTAAQPQSAADLADLPPIDSIGAGSDLRAFLAPGVPVELTRAALRRAWLADPAIRDFIGLSENAWDFTAPDGVPGFGPVTAEEVESLLARLAGEAEAAASGAPTSEPAAPEQAAAMPGADEPPKTFTDGTPSGHLADANNIAAQHEFDAQKSVSTVQRPRHGGALPK